ncbi:MAG: hypothetical protein ACPH64_06675 [Porticoccaceae bacterium]
MKKILVMFLLTTVSLGAVAEHHRGSDKSSDPGRKGGMFKQLDRDGDGAVSQEEHEAAISRMVEERRARFKTMDADADGTVTREEAAAARLKRKEGHRPPDRAED